MRSQPAVYGGRVFASGPDSTVVSLDAATGCTYWSIAAVAQVRSGIVVALMGDRPTVFFGDASGQAYAIDALSGKPLWQIRIDDHPAAMVTGTPAYFGGRLYVPVSSYEEASGVDPHYVCCTFRGSLLAIDSFTGRVIWKTYTIAEVSKPGKPTRRSVSTSGPSGAGIWSSPTLDPGRGVVYVTTGDNYSDPPTETSDAVLALALDTGRILWSRQITHGDAFNVSCSRPDQATCPDSAGPDFDFGSSPILVRTTDGQRALILPQKSGMLYAVDPDRLGKELWHSRVGNGSWLGGIQWGAASNDSNIYVALSDVGLIPTEQLGSKKVDIWGKPVPPGLTLDPQHGGGIFAFRADNGERLGRPLLLLAASDDLAALPSPRPFPAYRALCSQVPWTAIFAPSLLPMERPSGTTTPRENSALSTRFRAKAEHWMAEEPLLSAAWSSSAPVTASGAGCPGMSCSLFPWMAAKLKGFCLRSIRASRGCCISIG